MSAGAGLGRDGPRRPRGERPGAAALPRESELARVARLADRLLLGEPLHAGEGTLRSRRSGPGPDFLDLQPYAPGDDARGVDWRASARRGRPLVRRRHDASSSEWHVCLDASASMGPADGDKWTLALQLSAALVYLLLDRSHRVGLLQFSAAVDAVCPPGRGRPQYRRAARLLARARPAGAGGGSHLAACAAALRPRRSVVVVSDFLTPDGMRAGLDRLARLGGEVHALQVTAAEDVAAPADTEVDLLEDVETGARVRYVAQGPTPDTARAALARQRAALAAHCRRRRVAFTSVESGAGWREVLLGHLGAGHGRGA